MSQQQTFNPMNYLFSWTENWYEWDGAAAHKAALKARNAEAKRLKAQGRRVRCWSRPNQNITRGGIGTNHSEIDHFVTVYGLEVVG